MKNVNLRWMSDRRAGLGRSCLAMTAAMASTGNAKWLNPASRSCCIR